MFQQTFRGILGSILLLSVFLTIKVNPNWIYLAVFIGVMLVQSAFTNWCPMFMILKACGMKEKK